MTEPELTANEKKIYDHLVLNKGHEISRDELWELIDGGRLLTLGSNVIDVHIKNMRRKEIKIETIRGVGYMIV
mgnify:FL=1